MIDNEILQRVFFTTGRLFLLFVFVFSIQSPAQNKTSPPSTSKILFNRIPTELGLSQNVITCSLQDKAGFLWFGTKDGLNRFDGYQFKVYRYDPNDPASISDSLITALFEDVKGRMWVGTEKGLNLFDRQREIFQRILPDSNNPNSLSHQNIKSMTGDKQGVIWIGTTGGLDKLELSDGNNPLDGARFTHFTYDSSVSQNLDNFLQSQIVVDETGVIWVTVGAEIYRLTTNVSDGHYAFTRLRLPEEPGHFRAFCGGRNGKVWIAGNKGLFEWDTTSRQSVFHPYNPPLFPGTGKMIEDRNGTVWFGSNWGLIRFDPRENRFEFYPGDVNARNSIFEYGINSILEDKHGALWFGANGNGLFRYDRQAERFAHSQNGKLALWTGTSIRSFYETTDGDLLVGQASRSGILRVNRATGGSETFLSDKARNSLVEGTTLTRETPVGITYSMRQDKTGALWAGTDRFLLKMDLRRGKAEKFISYDVRPDPRKYPFGNIVYKLFEDRAENLWAVTLYGVYRFDPARNVFTEYPFETEAEDKAMDSSYPAIYEDPDGFFWIGTTDGFFRFDPNNGTFRIYRNDPQNPNSLSYNAVRTIAPDPHDPNVLWLGTKGGGLNRFDKRSETFSVLTEKDGLPNNVIYGILTDENGNLWMSTNNGISRFNPRSRTFKNFDKKDGLQDNEFNSCAFFKSKSGELFFGGINGFNAFYPADVKDNPNSPPVVLTDFQILNQPVSFREKGSPLKQAITETREITLDYEQRFFSFEFAALDFTEPGKNQYAYQLEGFDKDLVEVGTRRTAFYTNVPPGSYTFRVIASNNDGVWNREGATIRITILPPFWQTWWFRTVLVLLALGLIFLIVYPRFSKLRYEKEIQEAFAGQLIEEQENNRKRIAAELHDGLGQSLLIIRNRALLGRKTIKDPGSKTLKLESSGEQFDEISESAAEALEQVREIAYYLRPSELERLGLTSAIEAMIERVSDSSGIYFEIELAELEGVFSPEEEINFFRVVQENVNNIIKHSGAKTAAVSVKKDENGIELVIADNGRGFMTDEDKTRRRGFGLRGISERVRLLGGTYSVKSVLGAGTTVIVKIKK